MSTRILVLGGPILAAPAFEPVPYRFGTEASLAHCLFMVPAGKSPARVEIELDEMGLPCDCGNGNATVPSLG